MKRRQFIQNSALVSIPLAFGGFGCSRATETDVLILGGGVSGLATAYGLEKKGREYILLEGSGRLGGRLFFHPEIKRDVGGRGLGDRYDHTMKIINEIKTPLKDITDYLRNPTSIYYQGELHGSWEKETPNPRTLEYGALGRAPGLDQLDGWFQNSDRDIPYSELLLQNGLTEKDLDIINVAANYNDVRKTSAMNALHSGAFRKMNGTTRIYNFEGGSKTFVDQLASKLNGSIHTDAFVRAISKEGKKVHVTLEDGRTFKANKVICTLPFSTLRSVELSLNVLPNQKKAIEKLGYTKITQIHLAPKKSFWEMDEMPVDMWTDTPLERLMKMNFETDHHDLVCWVNGQGTKIFDNMSDAEIKKYTLDKLAEIRPSTQGNLEYIGTHKWGQYKYNKGAYAEFLAGQTAWFEDMIKPAGGIYFAGEHTARFSRGIEGAVESADRVLEEIG